MAPSGGFVRYWGVNSLGRGLTDCFVHEMYLEWEELIVDAMFTGGVEMQLCKMIRLIPKCKCPIRDLVNLESMSFVLEHRLALGDLHRVSSSSFRLDMGVEIDWGLHLACRAEAVLLSVSPVPVQGSVEPAIGPMSWIA